MTDGERLIREFRHFQRCGNWTPESIAQELTHRIDALVAAKVAEEGQACALEIDRRVELWRMVDGADVKMEEARSCAAAIRRRGEER